MFMDKILQVILIIFLLCCLETLLRIIFLVREGFSVHDTHVVNTVRPSLPDVADQKVSLLLVIIQRHGCIFEILLPRLGLSIPYCTTCMNEGIVAHVPGVELFSCQFR